MRYFNRIIVALGVIAGIALAAVGKIPAGLILLILTGVTFAAMTAWKDMRYTSFGGVLLIVIAASVLIASGNYATGSSLLILSAAIFVVMVWVETIGFVVRAAQAKGFHRDSSAPLWFIGLLATPLMLGVYVASLPDRGSEGAEPEPAKTLADELPAL